MAREQRHDVDYFPHDCNHGRKMHIIETKYGNDGYAVWFKLLEQLGKANYHFIDISDDMNFMFLTSIFKVEEEKLLEILKDLSRLGAIDQDLYENHKILYSEKFVNSVEDAYKKRKSLPLTPEEILKKLKREKNQSETETIQSETETPQTDSETIQKGVNPPEVSLKEKKSKGKERKGERTRALDFLKNEYPERFQTDFLMKYGKKIENKKKFAEDFNDTVDSEKREYDDALFGRLGKYARNWIENQEKFKPKKEDTYSTSNIPIG